MITPDHQTDVLRDLEPSVDVEPPPVRWGAIVAVVAAAAVALVGTVVAVAETVFRAEAERTIAAEFRTGLALPEGERVGVDIAGSALLQEITGRFDRVAVTVYSFPTGRANVDMEVAVEGFHRVGRDWEPDRLSGALTLSGAQASALFLPTEGQGALRVGFSGSDMIVAAPAWSGLTPQGVSVAITPRVQDGRLTTNFSSVTVGDDVLSAADFFAQTGADPALMQPPSVCLAEMFPRFLRTLDVSIRDQRLRVEFDLDVPAFRTNAGQELGSCT
ncbi:LmeA family phospholipid-binding protein [Microbacterium sp. HMWF026]|uniref:LmeA family phospholipid-binding protein n=1 Tax=Microbacterium sp. HMWF026 TaxID=2056861 RepID=UPI0015E801AB|nr:LmeA family phospholipid-binding protein [Microbacterium sp. HMWF026]